MVTRRKGILRVTELYFSPAAAWPGGGDLVVILQSPDPLPGAVRFHTIHVDLGADPSQIMGAFRSTTRNEIHRALDRDGITTNITAAPDHREVLAFAGFFDAFARGKALPPANVSKLDALAAAGGLVLAQACDASGDVLVRHALVSDGSRIRLLYSGSLFRTAAEGSRALIGRANRALHWQEMLTARAEGMAIYDLGGISTGPAGSALYSVDEFKRGFGGREVVEFNARIPRTILGRLADRWLRRAEPR